MYGPKKPGLRFILHVVHQCVQTHRAGAQPESGEEKREWKEERLSRGEGQERERERETIRERGDRQRDRDREEERE